MAGMQVAFHMKKSPVRLKGKSKEKKESNTIWCLEFVSDFYTTYFVTKPTIFLSLFQHRER